MRTYRDFKGQAFLADRCHILAPSVHLADRLQENNKKLAAKDLFIALIPTFKNYEVLK